MTEKLKQIDVDQIRLDAMTRKLIRCVKYNDDPDEVSHLRFPSARHDAYYMVKGNPPSDTDRHPWEKGLRLVMHIGNIPDSCRRAVKDLMQLQHDHSLSEKSFKEVRNVLMLVVAKHLSAIMGGDFKGKPASAQDLIDMEKYEQAALKKHAMKKAEEATMKTVVRRAMPKYMHPDRIKYQN